MGHMQGLWRQKPTEKAKEHLKSYLEPYINRYKTDQEKPQKITQPKIYFLELFFRIKFPDFEIFATIFTGEFS